MKAKDEFLLDLISTDKSIFYIPIYQRKYEWSTELCNKLIEDLDFCISHKSPNHFFGSIVFSDNTDDGYWNHYLIDGQQRITTLLLLCKAFNDCEPFQTNKLSSLNIDSTTGKAIIDFTSILYVSNSNCQKLKINLSEEDDKLFNDLFNGTYDTTIKSNLYTNYICFLNHFNSKEFDYLVNFFSAIKKLQVAAIRLNHEDDPQLIFESINSKLLPLKESDKIRNYIFMQLPPSEQQRLYSKYWKKIEQNVSDVNLLIKHYLTISTYNIYPNPKLYYGFKDYMLTVTKGNTSDKILENLYHYSKLLKKINSYKSSSKNEFELSIYRLLKLNVNTIYPFILVCLDKYEKKEISLEDINEITMYLESYVLRRAILSLSTAPLNKIFAFLNQEIEKLMGTSNLSFKDAFIKVIISKSNNSRFPGTYEFKMAFEKFDLYSSKELKKYVLGRLENYKNEFTDFEKESQYSIEHIMPQELTPIWINDLGDNYEKVYYKYVHTLGNLTYSMFNTELGQLSFDEKKNRDKIGYTSSKLYLNKTITPYSSWGEKEILDRFNTLFEKADLIWPHPTKLQFSVLDPLSWRETNTPTFVKEILKYMFNNNLLSDKDIENITDGDYCYNTFQVSYPFISEDRNYQNEISRRTGKKTTNKKIHYGPVPQKYKDKHYYISNEFYEYQFDALSKFFKSKLKL